MYINGFDHRADYVKVVILETDAALGTGTHTDSASATPGVVWFWHAFVIVIQRTEGVFLCTAFALGAALEKGLL
ncbi:hypothetical protein JCM39068_22420 [Desulfocastanea catecholica]